MNLKLTPYVPLIATGSKNSMGLKIAGENIDFFKKPFQFIYETESGALWWMRRSSLALYLGEGFREIYTYTMFVNLLIECCCLRRSVSEARESQQSIENTFMALTFRESRQWGICN